MKSLSAANKILGIEIYRDRSANKLYLSHRKYLKEVFECFDMQECRLMSTPFVAYFRLFLILSLENDEEKENMLGVLYASAIISIMCVMVCTRSNSLHTFIVVHKFIGNLYKIH
jgi:hypothetical protein